MIKDINEIDLNQRYTYADYMTWQFGEMVEWIRGRVFRMSPAPNLAHQRVSAHLLHRIAVFLEKRTCEVFHAPFDVRLPLLLVYRLKEGRYVSELRPFVRGDQVPVGIFEGFFINLDEIFPSVE